MFGKNDQTVFASFVRFSAEFIGIPAALESEMPEHLKRCVDGQTVHIQLSGFQNKVTGVVLFADPHRHLLRIACHLHNGVHDTSVILGAVLRCNDIQSVADLKKSRRIDFLILHNSNTPSLLSESVSYKEL